MKNTLRKIFLPAVLLTFAAMQTFGIEHGRSGRFLQIQDTLKLTQNTPDTTSVPNNPDTINIINPLDTIRIPEGLDTLDPFKFKYYIAIKDSATRAHTRDSLFAAGDTLEVTRLDSLYHKDSIEVALWKHQVWFNSLSKTDRKKYLYEQKMKVKKARMDSILHRKDSLKAIRDSITENTPRILETFAVPDSMHYKRLIMWERDRKFHDIALIPQDTSYNYNFTEYPFFQKDVNTTYLGTIGSPSLTYNYFKREETDGATFYSPYEIYTYNASNIPQYNTKTPYTELCYWGTLFANTEKEESNIRILTTQNITPELNVKLEYHRFGTNGLLKHEDIDNRTFTASTNYLGKRYLMHAGYIYNKIKKSENGGIVDNYWITDTLVDSREIDVALSNASTQIKKNELYLDQTYRIPFDFITKMKKNKEKKKRLAPLLPLKDSLCSVRDSVLALAANGEDSSAFLSSEAGMRLKQAETEIAGIEQEFAAEADSMNTNITTAFIGHSSDYNVFTKLYADNIDKNDKTGREFYHDNFFIHPTSTMDSLRVMKLENKLFLRLQPWSDEGIVSKIDAGVGDKLLNYYLFNPDNYLTRSKNVVKNSLYLYAGVKGQYKKYFKWDADGKFNFAGYELGDFDVNANMFFSFYPFRRYRKEPLNLNLHFETNLKEPDFYQQHLYTNHYKWDNDFSKISTTKAEAHLSIPKWKLDAGFGYALLSNNIYYDTLGIVRQNTAPMSVMTASLRKDFTLWKFHFDNRLLFQLSSNGDVLPLPMLALNLRYYFQFDVVKKVMQMQIGANALFTTKWYAPAYSPALGLYHNQKETLYGNCPDIDVFVNIQWKRACIFIKYLNAGMGWPNDKADYFSAHHYIRPQRAVKFGITWPFYVQTKAAGSSVPVSKSGRGGSSGRSGGGSGFGGFGGSGSSGQGLSRARR